MIYLDQIIRRQDRVNLEERGIYAIELMEADGGKEKERICSVVRLRQALISIGAPETDALG